MSISSCAPPRLMFSDHSLNALRLRRRDPKNAGSLCEAWKRSFNCDLTAHLALTVDRSKRFCNPVTHGVQMERLCCCLRNSKQYLRADCGHRRLDKLAIYWKPHKDWLPPRDSNPDMLIQSYFANSENKQNPDLGSAESGKVRQNPHPRRTKKSRNP